MDTFVEENSREERKSKLSYLDEFLSAIKIFGYLDAPVFHELTKSMHTQKLDDGEMLFLDEHSGFAICVEGEVQVYCKVGEEATLRNTTTLFNSNSLNVKDVVVVDDVRYQLLNTIKSGSSLSSIISVLNLLTDSQEQQVNTANLANLNNFSVNGQNQVNNYINGVQFPSGSGFPSQYQGQNSPDSNLPTDGFTLNNISPGATPSLNPASHPPRPPSQPSQVPKPDLIGIPKGNCTISIIPRESFIRLAAKYPKATSHIVQMILTKLYRVTFQTSHNYLGLTPDIMKTEENLNSMAGSRFKLPSYLYENLSDNSDLNDDDNDLGFHEISLKSRLFMIQM
ncbi:unnamed protein product [Ambrosiozyma monospora]|uniref:Unnamed protein product n=1 Tax=Ambrosiozyma monospora TaxID=43982 RepID=A0ACB5TN20_AMBMO|nr:unnamed protein product [Ambrosiozyma monospora]